MEMSSLDKCSMNVELKRARCLCRNVKMSLTATIPLNTCLDVGITSRLILIILLHVYDRIKQTPVASKAGKIPIEIAKTIPHGGFHLNA